MTSVGFNCGSRKIPYRGPVIRAKWLGEPLGPGWKGACNLSSVGKLYLIVSCQRIFLKAKILPNRSFEGSYEDWVISREAGEGETDGQSGFSRG